MESLSPLTSEELLELAEQDALGVLDQYDAAQFTREFFRAPLTIQQQIIELQAGIVSDVALLETEAPASSMRKQVLNAVANAVENEAMKLAPIASIGRTERSYEPVQRNPRRDFVNTWFWRAAVLALTVSLIIVSYFHSQAIRTGNQLGVLLRSDNTREQIEEMLGPTFRDFAGNPACRTVTLSSVNPEFDGSATLYINDRTNQAFLVALSMPQSVQPFALHNDRDGDTPRLRSFNTNNFVDGVRLDGVSTKVLTSKSWCIKDKDGIIVLRSS